MMMRALLFLLNRDAKKYKASAQTCPEPKACDPPTILSPSLKRLNVIVVNGAVFHYLSSFSS